MAFDKDMLTDDEVQAYLGIDVLDDMAKTNIALMKEAAAGLLNGSVGEEVDRADPRVKMLALAAVADMYDNRTYNDYSNKASVAVRNMVRDLSLQLILEGRDGE